MLTRITSYHLPANISKHIDYVTPGVKFIITSSKKSNIKRSSSIGKPRGHSGPKFPIKPPTHFPDPSSLDNCDILITPPCIKALYQIPSAPTVPNAANALGILEYGDTYDQEDLNLFFANYSSSIPQGSHPILEAVDGGVAPVSQKVVIDKRYGECLLDMMVSFPILYPQKVILFQTDDAYYSVNQTNGFMNTFLDAVYGVSYSESIIYVTC